MKPQISIYVILIKFQDDLLEKIMCISCAEPKSF